MEAGWGALVREFENEINDIAAEVAKEIGDMIGTIRLAYISESNVGGYGILYGNFWGMVLAHILLIVIGIFAIIGAYTVIKALLKLLFFGRKKSMSSQEKWLKTGRID